jgi:tetratricopeptide (TPR) repeat protein
MRDVIDRAVHLRLLGRLDEAEREVRMALADEPDDADLLSALSHVLEDAKRPEESLEAANAAAAVDPGHAYAHRRRVYSLIRLGRHDEAVDAARTSMSLDPENRHAVTAYAHALDCAGRVEEAEQAARRVVELAPDSDESHFLLGGIARRLGRKYPAHCAFAEALRCNPENATARQRMAEIDLEMGRPIRALAGFVEAGRMDPEKHDVLNSVGNVVWKLNWRIQGVICLATIAVLFWSGMMAVGPGAPGISPRVCATIALFAGAVAVWRAARVLPRGTASILGLFAHVNVAFVFIPIPICLVTYGVVAITGFGEPLWYVVPGIVGYNVLWYTALVVKLNWGKAASEPSS